MSIVASLALCVFGSIYTFEMLWIRSNWIKVPVTIESVDISRQSPPPGNSNYVVSVRYSYRIDETDYLSEFYKPRSKACLVTEEPEAAKVFAQKLKEQPPPYCRVNPKNHAKALLNPFADREFPLILLGMGIAIFIFTWGGTIYDAIRQRKYRAAENAPPPQLWRAVIGSVICFILFTAVAVGLELSQWKDEQKAADWIETPCVIKENELEYDSSEWQPYILYHWTIGNQTRQSKQVHFATWNGTVLQVEKLLKKFPKNEASVCFVNSSNPSEAVLLKNYRGGVMYPLVSILLIAMCIGAFFDDLKNWRNEMAAWNYWKSCSENDDDSPETEEESLVKQPHIGQDENSAPCDWTARFALLGLVFLILLSPSVWREWQLGVWFTLPQWILILSIGAIGLWLINRRAKLRSPPSF